MFLRQPVRFAVSLILGLSHVVCSTTLLFVFLLCFKLHCPSLFSHFSSLVCKWSPISISFSLCVPVITLFWQIGQCWAVLYVPFAWRVWAYMCACSISVSVCKLAFIKAFLWVSKNKWTCVSRSRQKCSLNTVSVLPVCFTIQDQLTLLLWFLTD